jgi:hypothetical protein
MVVAHLNKLAKLLKSSFAANSVNVPTRRQWNIVRILRQKLGIFCRKFRWEHGSVQFLHQVKDSRFSIGEVRVVKVRVRNGLVWVDFGFCWGFSCGSFIRGIFFFSFVTDKENSREDFAEIWTRLCRGGNAVDDEFAEFRWDVRRAFPLWCVERIFLVHCWKVPINWNEECRVNEKSKTKKEVQEMRNFFYKFDLAPIGGKSLLSSPFLGKRISAVDVSFVFSRGRFTIGKYISCKIVCLIVKHFWWHVVFLSIKKIERNKMRSECCHTVPQIVKSARWAMFFDLRANPEEKELF